MWKTPLHIESMKGWLAYSIRFIANRPIVRSGKTIHVGKVTTAVAGFCLCLGWSGEAFAQQSWVTSERLNRRTCPAQTCGVVGQLFFREAVTVFETRGGWARITKFYDASCVGGRSEYVDSGNSACDPSNGIEDGKFAEWVSAELISETRPPDPAESSSAAEALIAGSDDFARYRAAFVAAAESLIAQGQCTESDFQDIGGWVKSTSHRNEPIYFTYCGGMTISNRLYLNAVTGEIFR